MTWSRYRQRAIAEFHALTEAEKDALTYTDALAWLPCDTINLAMAQGRHEYGWTPRQIAEWAIEQKGLDPPNHRATQTRPFRPSVYDRGSG